MVAVPRSNWSGCFYTEENRSHQQERSWPMCLQRAYGNTRYFLCKFLNPAIICRLWIYFQIATEKATQIRSLEPKRTVVDLLRTPRLRRNILLLTLLWITIAVVYDGHARNTTNLGLSVFLTFSVASVTELPADLVVVFFLDRWGRWALAFGSLLGAAVFSLITLVMPSGTFYRNLFIILQLVT